MICVKNYNNIKLFKQIKQKKYIYHLLRGLQGYKQAQNEGIYVKWIYFSYYLPIIYK